MPRDAGLEAMLEDALTGEPGLSRKPLFGGLVWLLRGNMLCAARRERMLFRIGVDAELWALQQPGIRRMVFANGRQMRGWVHASEDAYGDPALLQQLVERALEVVRALPPQ